MLLTVLATGIVSAYVKKNRVENDQLPELITDVASALQAAASKLPPHPSETTEVTL